MTWLSRLSIAAIALTNLALTAAGPICNPCGAHAGMDPKAAERLGAVSFENSCKPGVQSDFNRAVALLHSFWLDEAERTFMQVSIADPNCAMAFWGVAMANFNEVNGGPTAGGVIRATQALARADEAREKDPREAAYIHALHAFFDGFTEKASDAHAKRYTDAMEQVSSRYPNDIEAQVFYALALINSDPPDDVALTNPKKAVAILYPLFRQHPNHPGIAHYIIHATDNPQMARQGLEAARRYASIAPAAPHALHMPSHIFARLGLWRDDIRSNLASESAAENPAIHAGAENRLHAMEFLEYAYLQIGHDEEARAIVDEGPAVKQADVDPRYPTYYADVQARYQALFAIETRDWTMAAKLQPIEAGDWVSQSQTLLAHVVAAAHLHATQDAQAAAQRVESLTRANPRMQTGAPRASVPDEIRAWARFAAGDMPGAISLLRPVADRQAKVGKGEVELPAREMMAEMFLLSGNFTEALTEYQASLLSDPNRFNALLGAGETAEALKRRKLAATYYRALLANCKGATGVAVEELGHARSFVRATM